MINDPELRQMLEEEARVIRKEISRLPDDDVESLRKKRKLKYRYDEIERLLGSQPHPYETLATKHNRLKRLSKWFMWLVLLLFAIHSMISLDLWKRLTVAEEKLDKSLAHEKQVLDKEAGFGHDSSGEGNPRK